MLSDFEKHSEGDMEGLSVLSFVCMESPVQASIFLR